MADIKTFNISVSESSIDILKQKLSLATFPDELDEAAWDYGTPLTDVKRLTKYWLEKYDWRTHEEKLNKMPQFITPIPVDGFGELDIHFVHQKSEVEHAIPLLFIHGWPGSFHEVEKILPLLTNTKCGEEPAFHVVAPSLPNFGFSGTVRKRGFRIPQYAETCHKLMLKLGYKEYVTQAGDWGWWISRTIGRLYPESCLASHVNMIYPFPPTLSKTPLLAIQHAMTPYTDKEKIGLQRSEWFHQEGYGYNSIQGTKPQTIGYAVADSPVALLAWLLEKLHDWTDSYPFTDDEILTWVSIYQFSTAGPAASLRIYYEAHHEEGNVSINAARGYIPHVKLGLGHFPKDIYVYPKMWARSLGDVVFQREHEAGGHFAAYERPEDLAGDLKSMFGRGGGAFGILKGKTGL
ncbi:hypothetical protein BP6252_00386 [Coleophoma cylindrospora]|uniref:Epoxide hydrolase N-terminal domain-containing protein n=1 Tax=Coleophoma cylindrospora TaxID=1849047 RepID=A0A3D8SQ85_9HELO|nr:hypothetical protein BP6252_00386 [Coleophoma cylindrospora]